MKDGRERDEVRERERDNGERGKRTLMDGPERLGIEVLFKLQPFLPLPRLTEWLPPPFPYLWQNVQCVVVQPQHREAPKTAHNGRLEREGGRREGGEGGREGGGEGGGREGNIHFVSVNAK